MSRSRYQAPVPWHRQPLPYATVSAHVAPLGPVRTLPFPLRSFASFCANGDVFALFSLQFSFVSGFFSFVLGSFFQGSSFVFKDFLASFPLFFIFRSSPLSPLAGAGRFWLAPRGQGGDGVRRNVSGLTTLVGYHGSGVLSSEDGYGPHLGGQAGLQQAVAPRRVGALRTGRYGVVLRPNQDSPGRTVPLHCLPLSMDQGPVGHLPQQ